MRIILRTSRYFQRAAEESGDSRSIGSSGSDLISREFGVFLESMADPELLICVPLS